MNIKSLTTAIIDNDIIAFTDHLEILSDLDEMDQYGFNPLIEAVIMQRSEMLQKLLSKKVNIDNPDGCGRTALHWAVYNNDLQVCKILLTHGANPNAYTTAGHPILVYPLLREQSELVNLLSDNGANIDFAKEYIHVKLLGHRYELIGQAFIPSSNKELVAVDFDGFYIEGSINIVKDSLARFAKNYFAKNLKEYFPILNISASVLNNLAILAKYQHYLVDAKDHKVELEKIFNSEIVTLPVLYQGHAITFTFFNNILVKCDRGANSKKEGTIVIYEINKQFNKYDLFSKITFTVNDDNYLHSGIKDILGLKTLYTMPIAPQTIGNCSWANTEAIFPIMNLLVKYKKATDKEKLISESLELYEIWQKWDKEQALYSYMQRIETANEQNSAVMASTLGAILVKLIADGEDFEQIKDIIKLLNQPKYKFVLRIYSTIFDNNSSSAIGEKLKKALPIN